MNKQLFSVIILCVCICSAGFGGLDVARVFAETEEYKIGSGTPVHLPQHRRGVTAEAEHYRIDSGDILEIMTWKEEDFTREVMVRLDGNITFPLLNDIRAAGLTPLELKAEIETRLKNYVEVPMVTVTVREPASQKFYILGEVVSTGEYPLTKNLTVLQAFALAGGFTQWASKNEIILFRKDNGEEKITRINYKDIIRGKDFSQNVLIRADDTIIVP